MGGGEGVAAALPSGTLRVVSVGPKGGPGQVPAQNDLF